MHRVVVIGDSAMWGQGLPQHEKYAFKYINELKDQGVDYHLDPHDFYPHSGAIIGDLSTSAPHTSEGLPSILAASNRSDYSLYAPEVPTDYPSIYKQVNDVSNPQTVKLVIFNGGINDVNMQSATEIDEDEFKKLVYKNIEQVAHTRFFKLLENINNTFTNARIVFVGYYPAISTKTRMPINDYQNIFGQFFKQFYNIPIPRYFLGRSKFEDIKRQGLELAQGFLLHTSMQIAKFNSLHNANILYCPSGFKEDNAIFADGESFVFAPNDPSDVAVTNGRKYYCSLEYEFSARHISDSILDLNFDEIENEHLAYIMCSQAYLLHPNTAGANKYVQQMHKIVTPFIEGFSLQQTLSTITNGPLSIRKATNKFKRKPVKSILDLLNHSLISTVIVLFDLRLLAVNTDFKFPKEVDFDFGWGKTRIAIPYLGGRAYNYAKLGVLDLGGSREMREVKKFQLYLPLFADFLKFNLTLKLFVNGFEMAEGYLNERSFTRQGRRMTWKHDINS